MLLCNYVFKVLCILILLEKWQLIRITFHQLINKKTKRRRRRTGSKARSKPSVRAKMHGTCGGFSKRENKTLRGFLSRCKYWWYILFIFFYIPSYVEEWTMNNVRGCKGYLQAGKFIVLYFLSCVICKLLTISKIITAVLSTLESLQLHYVRMFCVHTYTLPHPTFTHAHTGIHQERKQTAELLILLLQNIWQFCWTSPQKTHPPVLQWARGSEREQPAMKASTAWFQSLWTRNRAMTTHKP